MKKISLVCATMYRHKMLNRMLAIMSDNVDECIVVSENSTTGITLNDIIAVYQDWFPKNIGTNIQMPKRKDIKTNISKKYGAPKSGSKWFGIALKELTFQDDDMDI